MKIPTTLEVDKIFTEEDAKNRHARMVQCKDCKKWTKHADYDFFKPLRPCIYCKSANFDKTSAKSLRTFVPLIDNKRKPKK